jgi:hypothetical protein
MRPVTPVSFELIDPNNLPAEEHRDFLINFSYEEPSISGRFATSLAFNELQFPGTEFDDRSACPRRDR